MAGQTQHQGIGTPVRLPCLPASLPNPTTLFVFWIHTNISPPRVDFPPPSKPTPRHDSFPFFPLCIASRRGAARRFSPGFQQLIKAASEHLHLPVGMIEHEGMTTYEEKLSLSSTIWISQAISTLSLEIDDVRSLLVFDLSTYIRPITRFAR